jgi:anaerobic selenocysteine-containing dehydrogenase/Fe-S-cluster-containing dehydrogenase component
MADEHSPRLNRRTFLKIAGAAGVLAGCSPAPGPQSLIPYLVPPEEVVPGTPLFYRTVCRECRAACGVTARTREGRVVKLEGNPEDPVGGGALCGRGQAALQHLYAPDRLRGPMRRGAGGALEKASWDEAIGAVALALDAARSNGSAPGVRLITRPEPGSGGEVQRGMLAALGATDEQRLVLDPLDPAALRAAGENLFGRAELPVFDLGAARTVVSFGADFVETWGSPVEMARGFAAGRGKVDDDRTRLIWVGPRLCLTGASADQWLRVRPGGEAIAALALLRWLCDPASAVPGLAPESREVFDAMTPWDPTGALERSGVSESMLAALGEELARRRPSAILGPGVLSSGPQVMQLAAAVLLLNYVLGNVGRTVLYGLTPPEEVPAPFAAVRSLVSDMESGRVGLLLVHHADLVGTTPAALGAASAVGKVPFVVSFSDRLDATTKLAHWVLPDHHALESFGDLSPRRGITALTQPVMVPLWGTRSASQTLMDLAAKLSAPSAPVPGGNYVDLVLSRSERLFPGLSDDELASARRAAFERGGVYATMRPEAVRLRDIDRDLLRADPPEQAAAGTLPLVVYPTALRADGQGTDLPWLHEVPDPMTSVSWSDWVEVGPATARRLGIDSDDLLEITTDQGSVELPAYIYPGLVEDAIAMPLGNTQPLALLSAEADGRSGALVWIGAAARARSTGRRVILPRLEGTPYKEGREIARTVSPASPVLARPAPSKGMYPPPVHPVHRWAMTIDMDRCTGCQACIVACYAENNVPVNGPELAIQGRNMEWLRVERYFSGRAESIRADLILMLCQHCTSAPCEPVCPVYATYHTREGLNAQVYNRCVGTRYCSNNCPYKVRTFNWRDPAFPGPLDYQLNPDVTVRSKGVMEKCTLCVQRIRAAEIAAEKEHRPVGDGEIATACAQTCPTRAIVFGDANNPDSEVSRLARQGRSYRVLEHLNTGPAITYLARVREV